MSIAASIQWTRVASPGVTGDLLWLREVKGKLEDIQSLPHNWDLEGGAAIDEEIVRLAGELLLPLHRLNPPMPRIAPILGGGIQFEWRRGDKELEIEITPDGRVEYLAIEGDVSQEDRLPDPHNDVWALVEWLTDRR
jgi:hypothetical protein